MEKNGILHASRLLTGQFVACSPGYVMDRQAGYVPNADGLEAIVKLVKKLKSRDPDLVYLLDRGLTFH
jgi:succinate dehydrogenase/fumarate reductase flavoprotein subunit